MQIFSLIFIFPKNLDVILNATPSGLYVYKDFEENNAIGETARSILVDAVITWANQSGKHLSRKDFKFISEQIEIKFKDNKVRKKIIWTYEKYTISLFFCRNFITKSQKLKKGILLVCFTVSITTQKNI